MSETRESLLGRVRNLDDRTSWEEFDGIYRPLLTGYALARGLTSDEAEEVAQQCLTSIVTQIQSFERRVGFRGWLRSMIDHKVDDHLRTRIRMRGGRTRDFDREQASEANPALQFERQWNKTHLLCCLNEVRHEVAPVTFEAFELYVLREWPVLRIADRLGMTPNQVYVAKHRIMDRLKKRWAELADGVI